MKKIYSYGKGVIHYNDQGKGKVIVLIHGYLETSEIWTSFARKLAEKFRVISVDLPGHGGSDIFSDVHTVEFMATVIKDLIEDTGTGKIFLTGHSMGGYVTLAFADLFPEKLTGYCLFHSHPFADSAEVVKRRKMEIRLIKAGKWNMFFSDSIQKMFASQNLEKFKAELHHSKKISASLPGQGIISVLNGMMTRPSRLSVMEEGWVPLLWILGAMDNYINCEQIQGRVRLPANAKVCVLPDSGHMGFVEEEEYSLKVLAEFVNKCG
jgi:pimeloyl-ACP methyl ester carboxylesterase